MPHVDRKKPTPPSIRVGRDGQIPRPLNGCNGASHHLACACRESRFKRMEEVLRRIMREGLLDSDAMGQWLELQKEVDEVLREG